MPSPHRVLAHHLILSSYGFWLANDPRGSGSTELREPKFEDLGPIHPGRKYHQPTREQLRAFYKKATPKLEHAPLWFNEPFRNTIGKAFTDVVTRCRYTIWECFIGSNHAHLCIRAHRDNYETIWQNLTAQSRTTAIAHGLAPEAHPVWADRPYSVYCASPEDIRRTIQYIQENAAKERLPLQHWPFVQPYDGWPLHKK
jgi:REP element-mobilizing transposase RayT